MGTKTTNLIGFSISKAHLIQNLLSKKIIKKDRLPEKIKSVAGVDAAYCGGVAVGAVSVMDYDSLELLESQTATCRARIPYISTLLSFREIHPVTAAIRKLKLNPDIFMVDAHGLAHPFKFGFASHLGVALGKPTIGVAKSRLIGEPKENGENVHLIHNGEVIGSVLVTKMSTKPVYVSIGHLVSLSTALKIVEHCTRGNRIPEPLLAAHKRSSEEIKRRYRILEKTYVSPNKHCESRWNTHARRN